MRCARLLSLLAPLAVALPAVAQDTWRVSGEVRAPDGAIAGDAIIRLPELGRATENRPDDGTFTIDSVPDGSWRIEAESKLGTRTTTLTVDGVDIDNFVLTLQPPASLSGRISIPELSAPQLAASRITLEPGAHTATTDGDGDYHIPALPSGWYTALATRDGYRDTEQRVFADGPTILDLTLEPDRTHTLTLTLAPSSTSASLRVDGGEPQTMSSGLPLALELSSGAHTIALSADGHQTLSLPLTLEQDTALTLAPVSLEAPRTTHSVGCALSPKKPRYPAQILIVLVLLIRIRVSRAA